MFKPKPGGREGKAPTDGCCPGVAGKPDLADGCWAGVPATVEVDAEGVGGGGHDGKDRPASGSGA